MTDEEREQLETLTVKIEYLVQENVHFTSQDHNSILRALSALGQAHNAAMFQDKNYNFTI